MDLFSQRHLLLGLAEMSGLSTSGLFLTPPFHLYMVVRLIETWITFHHFQRKALQRTAVSPDLSGTPYHGLQDSPYLTRFI